MAGIVVGNRGGTGRVMNVGAGSAVSYCVLHMTKAICSQCCVHMYWQAQQNCINVLLT